MRSRALALVLFCSCEPFAFGPSVPAADALRECNDGIDNDGNGLADFPYDPGCASELDPQEAPLAKPPACADGIDNDGDGRIDFDVNHDGVVDGTDDPGCSSAADDNEFNVLLPECADGIDNDGDGKIDYPADPQCDSRNDDHEDR